MTTLNDVLQKQTQSSILQAPKENSKPSLTVTGSASATMSIALQNNTDSSNCFAYITGLDSSTGTSRIFILESDGVTGYFPDSPADVLSPLAQDCNIQLGAPGSVTTVTIPHLDGARIWLCKDAQLTFLLNPGPALVEPSVSNTSDPNFNLSWSFCEFTFDDTQFFGNITYVDFVGLPLSITLQNASGGTQTVGGLPPDGLDSVCSLLQQQAASDGAGWNQLVVTDPTSGANLRALSPNSGISVNPSLFQGYYQSYVDSVWSQYESETLTVDTQGQWGVVTGQVVNGELTFGDVASFAQPAAADIFSCSTGPFANTADEIGNISARLCAAFNRSTLLTDTNQPDGESISNYYLNTTTNHYARIVHSVVPDGRGYTFPYDDVDPNSNSNVAGTVADPNPTLLTVFFGGIDASTTASNSSVVTRVPVGQLARSGGANRQQIGGRSGGRNVRRGLPELHSRLVLPLSADDEKAVLAARDAAQADDEALVSIDLEKGLAKFLAKSSAAGATATTTDPATRDGVPAAVRALLRRMGDGPAARRAKPVLEAVARAVVEVLRISVGSIVGRAVVVAILVLASFVLGFFWPGGEESVRTAGLL